MVNATGVQGLAAQVAAALEVQGFPKPTTSSSTDRPNGVVVEYGTGQKEAARTVAAAFEGATLREHAAVTSGVRVVLGAGAPAVQEVPNRTGSSPVPTPTVSAPRAHAHPHDHGPHGRPGHLLLRWAWGCWSPPALGGGGGSRGPSGLLRRPLGPAPGIPPPPPNENAPLLAGRFRSAEAEGFEPSMGLRPKPH